MLKLRNWMGLIGGALLLLDAAAHTLLGWPGMRGELAKAGASEELIQGVQLGWVLGGAGVFAFGFICIAIFVHALRGQPAPRRTAQVIGATLVAYGAWAIAASREPFMLVLLVPGLLVSVGGWPAPKG